MIGSLFEAQPEVDVQEAEYVRLLGYPRGWVLDGRAKDLADGARRWFAAHGRPWVSAREVAALDTSGDEVRLERVSFHSRRLLKTLRDAGAHGAILVAATAGPELEQEAQRLWRDEKPDEYFFLEVFGSAVVEHLVTMTGARLCAWAEGLSWAVLPHYSPGYPEWTIEEQPALLDLINDGLPRRTRTGTDQEAPGPIPISVMESGMLRPKKSLLAVFGVTRHVERVRPLTDLVPCDNCSFLACQFRRTPYRRAPAPTDPELPPSGAQKSDAAAGPLDRAAGYSVSRKALRRWSEERLSMTTRAGGTIDAVFRYEGTTCTNMGRPLHFLYRVTLGGRDQGYPVQSHDCAPAPGDDGYAYMCQYLIRGEELMLAIGADRPLLGRPLNDVVASPAPSSPAGCYCDRDSRLHKWRLVLETIHYALAQEGTRGDTR